MTEEEEEHLAHERVTAVPISQPLPQPTTHLPLPKIGLAAPSQVVFSSSVALRRGTLSARGRRLPGPGAASGTLDEASMRRLQASVCSIGCVVSCVERKEPLARA
jgi:hypothetical protein